MMQKVASAKKDSYNNANWGRFYCKILKLAGFSKSK
jgi:hypothetical protein